MEAWGGGGSAEEPVPFPAVVFPFGVEEEEKGV